MTRDLVSKLFLVFGASNFLKFFLYNLIQIIIRSTSKSGKNNRIEVKTGKNCNDTEKIRMALMEGWHTQIEKWSKYFINQSGAAEVGWAHNPQVLKLKLGSDMMHNLKTCFWKLWRVPWVLPPMMSVRKGMMVPTPFGYLLARLEGALKVCRYSPKGIRLKMIDPSKGCTDDRSLKGCTVDEDVAASKDMTYA